MKPRRLRGPAQRSGDWEEGFMSLEIVTLGKETPG
jgi:hypothetical protein